MKKTDAKTLLLTREPLSDPTLQAIRPMGLLMDLIGKDWMLVTAGTPSRFNTMTASWGGIGWLWNRPVAFVFVRPERYTHSFIESAGRLTLSFYGEAHRKALQLCGTRSGRDTDKPAEAGLTPVALDSGTVSFRQALLTLDCRKLFRTEMAAPHFVDSDILDRWYGPSQGGLHTVYVAEIETIYTPDTQPPLHPPVQRDRGGDFLPRRLA